MWCEVHKAKLWQKLAMLVLIIQRLVPPKTSSTQANQESGMRGSSTRAKRVEYQCRYTRCRQWRSRRTNALLALATCSQGCIIARGSTLLATKRTKPLQKVERLELNFLQCDAGTKFREHHRVQGYLAHQKLPPPRTLGPYLGPYGCPLRVTVSYERDTPVGCPGARQLEATRGIQSRSLWQQKRRTKHPWMQPTGKSVVC